MSFLKLFIFLTCLHAESKKNESTDSKSSMFQKRDNNTNLFLRYPFFGVGSFNIPVIKSGRLYCSISLTISAEFNAKKKGKINIKDYFEVLYDKVFIDLYNYFNVLWFPERSLNLIEIKKIILKSLENRMGRKTIKEIALKDLYIKLH